ncbi:MAG TPA: exonuclease domain-containing protein [Solirubrobacteraceae bacterium]|nr:exonuclease domain-containing protein [Solirubrobacteraceae bacterium]
MRLRRRRSGNAAADAFRARVVAGPQIPWRESEWCAVDLELTGLDPRRDEIVAIGAVPIRAGRVELGSAYYSLARPRRAPRGRSVLVHKLRGPDLAGAPTLERALDGLLTVLAGRRPVYHTAWVEEAFLGRALHRRGIRLPPAADTERLGRRWLAQASGAAPAHVTLTGLAARLGFTAEAPHHALGDALTTAQAFIALAAMLDRATPQTVGSLLGPEPAARRMG